MILLFFTGGEDTPLEPGAGVVTEGSFAGCAGPVTVPLLLLGLTR